jgi:hypothetical protein
MRAHFIGFQKLISQQYKIRERIIITNILSEKSFYSNTHAQLKSKGIITLNNRNEANDENK